MAEPHGVRIVEGLHVLALRHLPGGTAAVEAAAAAQGLAPLPPPGACSGTEPCAVWTRPSEWLLLTAQAEVAQAVLQALAPGRHALACALDLSAGHRVVELSGVAADAMLPRLCGTGAWPRQAGQGGRTRCVDTAVVLLRPEPGRVWLVAERALSEHVEGWLAHAAQGEDEDGARARGR